MYTFRSFVTAACLLVATTASAHEYWLDPADYQVQPGAKITANIRNGQLFEGMNLAYIPNRTERFDLMFDGKQVAVEGRMGDSPALQIIAPPTDGLLIAVHEASKSKLTYTEWEKVVGFAEHKDFPDMVADHIAAGYPQDKVREDYWRFSKTLIAVGDGHGADVDMGMETELTALTNPYAADFDDTMQIALTYQNAPRAASQIEVYERDADNQVIVTKYRTDADGHASFPVRPGMTYLVDAVKLRPGPEAGETPDAAHWQTLWASLTFAVPE
jgi:uncharacterized GH25 family protein